MERTRSASRDLWAFCGVCAKWFYVPRSVEPDHDGVTCPVCDVPSVIFKTAEDSAKHRVAPRPSA